MHADDELMKYSVLRVIRVLHATTVSKQRTVKELVTTHIHVSN